MEFGVPISDIHAQFTVDNLAALVYEEWRNVAWHRENLGKAIRERLIAETTTSSPKPFLVYSECVNPSSFKRLSPAKRYCA